MPVTIVARHRGADLELPDLTVQLVGDRVDDPFVHGEAELVVLEGVPVGPWGAEVVPELAETAAGVWTVAAALLRLDRVLVSVEGLDVPAPPQPGGPDAVH